jgi:hypothetical protein
VYHKFRLLGPINRAPQVICSIGRLAADWDAINALPKGGAQHGQAQTTLSKLVSTINDLFQWWRSHSFHTITRNTSTHLESGVALLRRNVSTSSVPKTH